MFLREYKNRSYINDTIIPFKGDYSKHYKTNKRFLYVYKITCIPTNEVYIGIHMSPIKCIDPLKDSYNGSGVELKKRKCMYNWFNDFKFEIIKFCSNEQELDESERYYILDAREKYGNLCINSIFAKGGHTYPLWNPENYDKHLQRLKKLNSDIEFKKKRSNFMRDLCEQQWSNDSFKQRHSDRASKFMKSQWKNDEFRELIIKSTKEHWKDEQFRKKMSNIRSDIMKKKWENKEYRTRMSTLSSNRINSILNDEVKSIEYRNKLSENALRQWKQTDLRDKVSKAKSKKILVLYDFISPLNGVYFKSNTIFNSAKECAIAIGYKGSFASNVMNSSHAGKWISRKRGKMEYITTFEYISE